MARFGWLAAFAGLAALVLMQPVSAAEKVPQFQIDTSWPKPLPNNWIFGQIGGIFVDPKDDTIWISQRPRTVNDRDKRAQRGDKAKCCITAPSVVQFDQQGNVLQAWGGPETAKGYEWPQNEHGMFVDTKGNVWLAGNGENDGMVLKFTHDGKFLMQIGKSAKQTNSLETTRVGRTADMVVDPATNELYVADGYFNHRVAVFDAAVPLVEIISDEKAGEIKHDRTRQVAERLGEAEHWVFMGSGPSYATALFSAAKLVESCGANAWGQDIEEWAHIQFFNRQEHTPTCVIIPPGRSVDRALELLPYIKGIGRQTLAVASSEQPFLPPQADIVLPVPQAVPEVFSPLVYCLAGELLAYYLAEVQGSAFFQATRSFRSSGDRLRESHTLRHPDDLARMEEGEG